MVDKKNPEATVSIKPINRNKLLWLVVVALLVVGLIIWTVVSTQSNNQVVFTIQGRDYRVSDIQPQSQFAIKELRISKGTVYNDIYQADKYITAAKDLGITPTASEINTQQQQLNGSSKGLTALSGYSAWSNLQAERDAISNLLDTAYQGGNYQGYSFIFWFGNLLTSSVTYTPPNYGNQTLINQDKQYAMQQANYYYAQLKNKKMTTDQIVKAILNDPKLAIDYTVAPAGASPNNLSIHFGVNPNTSWEDQTFYEDVNNWVTAQTKPALSSIRTGQTELSSSTNTLGDTYYYFVELDKVGFSAGQFNQELKSLPSHYYGVGA